MLWFLMLGFVNELECQAVPKPRFVARNSFMAPYWIAKPSSNFCGAA
jgi:hypothetical protein